MNIIYLRVSKEEETIQDLEAQKTAILDKFGIKDYTIYKERGSAYNLNKFHKRKEFLTLINLLFDPDTKIPDLFLRHYKVKEEFNLFVWDYARIMRNFEYNLLFGLLADLFNVNIYSYKDGKINKKETETPTEKLARYMLYAISAFGAEDYSYQTSQNIKKSIKQKEGLNYGTSKDPNGIKWGKKFTDPDGNKREVSIEELAGLNKRIIGLDKYYRKHKINGYYDKIIFKIVKEFNVKISKSYVSVLLKQRKLKN